jgi:alkyl hydroperoxide reductase subunit F
MNVTMEFNLQLSNLSSEHKSIPLEHDRVYDVLIVGGGPAALTAAVYCMRKGISTGLITENFGGQVAETSTIENYMGYAHIEGIELVKKFTDQVKQFEIGYIEGIKASKVNDGKIKKVVLDDGQTFQARSLIITTGTSWRKLNVPGERELTGKGVAYCSICDAPLFVGKKVAVVGGGNSGVESAIDLAKIAQHVTLVQFLDTLTADEILIKSLNGYSNVDILYEHEIKEIKGINSVESIIINNRKTNEESEVDVKGVFVEIGLHSNTDFVKGVLDLNEFGEIIVDCACNTNVPGIFAAGDATSVPYKQIIIAAGEGAKAALSAYQYVLKG